MTRSAPAGQDAAAGRFSAARTIVAVIVLAAVAVTWAAEPLAAKPGPVAATVILVGAIGCAALSVAQLALSSAPRTDSPTASLAERTWQYLLGIIMGAPWAELMVVLALLLDVVHRAPAWHVGLLGVALTGYLLAIHLYETRAVPRVLAGQLPLIAAGIGLAALAVGAAGLPGHGSGDLSLAIRLVSTAGACVVGGLALPIWFRRRG